MALALLFVSQIAIGVFVFLGALHFRRRMRHKYTLVLLLSAGAILLISLAHPINQALTTLIAYFADSDDKTAGYFFLQQLTSFSNSTSYALFVVERVVTAVFAASFLFSVREVSARGWGRDAT